MNFQLIKAPSQDIKDFVFDFCLKSKPYDFCSFGSHSIRKLQIQDFYEQIINENEIYILTEENKIKFFIAIRIEENNKVCVDFIIGKPFSLESNFRNFRLFYREKFKKDFLFYGIVRRKHRKDLYLRGIKKRDPNVIFSLANGEIYVSWIK